LEYYIEFIIFQEFIVDFILLYITGSLFYKKTNFKRVIAASLVGVVYSLAVYLMDREFLSNYIVKFLVSILMLTIAHSPKGFLGYVRFTLCFYILSILIMGIIVISYYFFNSRLTIILLFSAIFIAYALFKLVLYEIRKSKSDKNYFRDVVISLDGNSVELVGFIDTGNEMIDALSKRPVIIADINYLKNLFKTDVFNELKSAYENSTDYLIDLMFRKLHNYNFRLLKYNTINSADEYMIGVIPSKAIVKYKGNERCIDCIIGIYPKALSDENKFQALLYKKILDWEGGSVEADEYY
jgi:stage II sporulation protein GA (sporulation sigma-E factor processing peptidase)